MVKISPKYTKYVKGYTKYLRTKNVEKRRKGAMMVGELGAAETIERLIELAENDPDPIVRKNAKYSLGMFAAFKDAVESDDEERQDAALDSLSTVLSSGRIGKRARYSPRLLGRIQLLLGIALVVLLLANGAIFFLLGDGEIAGFDIASLVPERPQTIAPDAAVADVPDQDINILVANARRQIVTMTANAGTLRTQLAPLAANGGVISPDDCRLFYNLTLSPLQLSRANQESFPAVGQLYAELNVSLEAFNEANAFIDQTACPGEAVEAGTAQDYLDDVTAFEEQSSGWEATLEQALVIPTEIPPPATDAPPTATATETPDLRRYAAELSGIIDEANGGGRSPAQLLNQYWQDALANDGDIDGCDNPTADIPGDYNLPDAAAEFSPELRQATEQVNAGLQVLRDGWNEFQMACAAGPTTVLGAAPAGLTITTTADQSFDSANDILQGVLGQ